MDMNMNIDMEVSDKMDLTCCLPRVTRRAVDRGVVDQIQAQLADVPRSSSASVTHPSNYMTD